MSSLRPYPFPFKAWLTLSNDPDCTRIDDWHQLHRLIWEELALPFADTFFVTNHSAVYPDQVNLREHPEIAVAHPHDSMHTWGDYCSSTTECFHRGHAERDLARIQELGLRPLIWIDHANFTGNLLHRAGVSQVPEITDAAGNRFENLLYSLDLIRQAGVRYLWDGFAEGELVGQERPVTRREWYALKYRVQNPLKLRAICAADWAFTRLWDKVDARFFGYVRHDTRQLRAHTMPDGSRFHIFPRFGHWDWADIDGLAEGLSPSRMDALVNHGGTAIVYTHLGKRQAARVDDPEHIPAATREALGALKDRFASGELMLSPTSTLLDYLVLRQHALLTPRGLDLRGDGIRFDTLTAADLVDQRFTLNDWQGDDPKLLCEGSEIPHRVTRNRDGSIDLCVEPTAS